MLTVCQPSGGNDGVPKRRCGLEAELDELVTGGGISTSRSTSLK